MKCLLDYVPDATADQHGALLACTVCGRSVRSFKSPDAVVLICRGTAEQRAAKITETLTDIFARIVLTEEQRQLATGHAAECATCSNCTGTGCRAILRTVPECKDAAARWVKELATNYDRCTMKP